MSFDPLIGELVLFGGSSEQGALSDTWGWDGEGWTSLRPARAALANPSLSYDANTRQLFLFGSQQGAQLGQQRNLVWSWKAGDWTQAFVWDTPDCGKSCTGPLAMPFNAGAVTYDAALGKIIMLAGGPPGPGAQTWTWDGWSWTSIPTAHPPLTVSGPVFNSANGQLLAIGYAGQGWGGINRTWIFNGSDWALSAAFTPDGEDVRAVDDPENSGVLLVVGGRTGHSMDTWLWNGSAWKRIDSGGLPLRADFSLGYDAAHQQVVMFGGRDEFGRTASETWVWDGRSWQKRG